MPAEPGRGEQGWQGVSRTGSIPLHQWVLGQNGSAPGEMSNDAGRKGCPHVLPRMAAQQQLTRVRVLFTGKVCPCVSLRS